MSGQKKKEKRIAVIGAGTSGLLAIKCCKEEALNVVCYEKTNKYGGSWNYRYEPVEGVGAIRKSTTSLYSKEMNAFGDFPPPETSPNYMNHEEMMDYIDAYSENFELLSHVNLEEEVVQVIPATDCDTTSKWLLKIKTTYSKELVEEIFDGVIVCSGKKGYPYVPKFCDQDAFLGIVLHSRYLKSATEFQSKNVLIVGFGNSAVEAAVEICPFANQVYLSTRSGGWVVPKLGKKGHPSDTQFLRRNMHWMQNVNYDKFSNKVEQYVNSIYNHDMYNVRPRHSILAKRPVINDDFPDKVLTGRILIKGDIQKFESNGVVFCNETEVTRVDVVIFATGYQIKYPFLNNELSLDSDKMYKCVFPTTIQHPTLAVVGLVHPLGPNIPVWETQCRFVSRVFSGKLKLPSQDRMTLLAQEDCCRLNKRFSNNFPVCPQVDYIDYVDDIAKLCDFKPNFATLFGKERALCWACFAGPCLPYQYRLQGPHCWNEARETILSWQKRVFQPLQRRSKKTASTTHQIITSKRSLLSASVFTLALCLVYMF